MKTASQIGIEIEVTEVVTSLPNGGWKGSAKIDGKIYTGEFSAKETYTNESGEEFEVDWSLYL